MSYIYTLAWILKCLKLYPSISLIDDSAAATQPLCQSGWCSHSATHPLCQSGWSSHSATQPLCQSRWRSHSATQPLCRSGWRSSHSVTLPEWLEQPLSHPVTLPEWLEQPLSHSATQPEWLTQPLSHSASLPEWLEQPLSHSVSSQWHCQSGWAATRLMSENGWSSHSVARVAARQPLSSLSVENFRHAQIPKFECLKRSERTTVAILQGPVRSLECNFLKLEYLIVFRCIWSIRITWIILNCSRLQLHTASSVSILKAYETFKVQFRQD